MKQIDRRESAATSLEKQSQMRVFPSLRVSGLLFVPQRTRSQSFLSCQPQPAPRIGPRPRDLPSTASDTFSLPDNQPLFSSKRSSRRFLLSPRPPS